MIRLRFTSYDTPLSREIAALQYGFWASHVDAVLANNRCLGARTDGVTSQPGNYDYLHRTHELPIRLEASKPMTDVFYNWLNREIGTPYDPTFLEIPPARNWRDPSSWFCSELIASGLVLCGFLKPLPQKIDRVSPRDLLMILSGLVSVPG